LGDWKAAIASRLTPTRGAVYIRKNQVDCQAAFASRLAPTEKQSSAAARGKAAPLNNERKLECF